MFLYRYYSSSTLLLCLIFLTKICLSFQIKRPNLHNCLFVLRPIFHGSYLENVNWCNCVSKYRTPSCFNLNSFNSYQQNNDDSKGSSNCVNINKYNEVSSLQSNELQFDESNSIVDQFSAKNDSTDRAKLISFLCSYDENPHLIQQIQSRINNYDVLINKFKVDPFPEVSADDYDDFSRVVSENESLNNGQETERCYKVYGRVESIRFDGHFMHIVNINREFKNYTNAELIQKRLTKNSKIQIMFRLDDPILVCVRNCEVKSVSCKDYSEVCPCKEIVGTVDIGDVLELYGNAKKTNLGEISIIPKKIKFLSKCLIPPPSKQHGLKDTETRLRLRHLDLMINEKSRMHLLKRFHIISKIRKFLSENNYMEIDTPILNHYDLGNLSESFETYYNKLQQKVKLRIAPEFNIKKLMLGLPFKKVFEIGKCFRNEGTSLIHSPEFTMIEIYEKLSDYNQMINLFERIVNYVLSYSSLDAFEDPIKNSSETNYVDGSEESTKKADVGTVYEVKWIRKRFDDAIKEFTDIDIKLYSKEELEEKLIELSKTNESADQNSQERLNNNLNSWGEVANEIFENFVVPKLTYPVHITNLPVQISPLCYYDLSGEDVDCFYENGTDHSSEYKRNSGDCKLFSNRFESYLGGMEVAHGCTEQCNPFILSSRLVNGGEAVDESLVGIKAKIKEVDKEFMHSVFCGAEPMSGLGIGVDRLVMFVTKAKNIKEIQPLPSLRKL